MGTEFPGPDWLDISAAPTDRAVRLYWPRIRVDDDGDPTSEEMPEMGMEGVGAFRGGWPAREPSRPDITDGYGLDWIYGQPTCWKPAI